MSRETLKAEPLHTLSITDLKVLLKWTTDGLHEIAEHYCRAQNESDTEEAERLQAELNRYSILKKEVEDEINRRCSIIYELVFDL